MLVGVGDVSTTPDYRLFETDLRLVSVLADRLSEGDESRAPID